MLPAWYPEFATEKASSPLNCNRKVGNPALIASYFRSTLFEKRKQSSVSHLATYLQTAESIDVFWNMLWLVFVEI